MLVGSRLDSAGKSLRKRVGGWPSTDYLSCQKIKKTQVKEMVCVRSTGWCRSRDEWMDGKHRHYLSYQIIKKTDDSMVGGRSTLWCRPRKRLQEEWVNAKHGH